MNKLLFNEHPLVILPELAVCIGLNEAIVLQQVHYWIQKSDHVIDGRTWVYNSVEEWSKQFPFFSPSTVRRTIEKLTECGYLLTGCFNKLKMDKTKWYTIDYARLDSEQEMPFAGSAGRSAQNEQMESPKMSTPIAQDEQIQSPKMSKAIPETIQKQTPENTTTTGDGGDVEMKINNVGDLPWYLRAAWGEQGKFGHKIFNGSDGLNAYAKSVGFEELQACIDIAAEATPELRSIRYLKGIVAKRAAERIAEKNKAASQGISGGSGLVHFVCDTCGFDGSMPVAELVKHRGRTFGCQGCDTRHSVDKLLEGTAHN